MNSREKREDMIANLIILVILAGLFGGILYLVEFVASFFN